MKRNFKDGFRRAGGNYQTARMGPLMAKITSRNKTNNNSTDSDESGQSNNRPVDGSDTDSDGNSTDDNQQRNKEMDLSSSSEKETLSKDVIIIEEPSPSKMGQRKRKKTFCLCTDDSQTDTFASESHIIVKKKRLKLQKTHHLSDKGRSAAMKPASSHCNQTKQNSRIIDINSSSEESDEYSESMVPKYKKHSALKRDHNSTKMGKEVQGSELHNERSSTEKQLLPLKTVKLNNTETSALSIKTGTSQTIQNPQRRIFRRKIKYPSDSSKKKRKISSSSSDTDSEEEASYSSRSVFNTCTTSKFDARGKNILTDAFRSVGNGKGVRDGKSFGKLDQSVVDKSSNAAVSSDDDLFLTQFDPVQTVVRELRESKKNDYINDRREKADHGLIDTKHKHSNRVEDDSDVTVMDEEEECVEVDSDVTVSSPKQEEEETQVPELTLQFISSSDSEEENTFCPSLNSSPPILSPQRSLEKLKSDPSCIDNIRADENESSSLLLDGVELMWKPDKDPYKFLSQSEDDKLSLRRDQKKTTVSRGLKRSEDSQEDSSSSDDLPLIKIKIRKSRRNSEMEQSKTDLLHTCKGKSDTDDIPVLKKKESSLTQDYWEEPVGETADDRQHIHLKKEKSDATEDYWTSGKSASSSGLCGSTDIQVKEEPENLKFGYTQEVDTIMLDDSDDDDFIQMSQSIIDISSDEEEASQSMGMEDREDDLRNFFNIQDLEFKEDQEWCGKNNQVKSHQSGDNSKVDVKQKYSVLYDRQTQLDLNRVEVNNDGKDSFQDEDVFNAETQIDAESIPYVIDDSDEDDSFVYGTLTQVERKYDYPEYDIIDLLKNHNAYDNETQVDGGNVEDDISKQKCFKDKTETELHLPDTLTSDNDLYEVHTQMSRRQHGRTNEANQDMTTHCKPHDVQEDTDDDSLYGAATQIDKFAVRDFCGKEPSYGGPMEGNKGLSNDRDIEDESYNAQTQADPFDPQTVDSPVQVKIESIATDLFNTATQVDTKVNKQSETAESLSAVENSRCSSIYQASTQVEVINEFGEDSSDELYEATTQFDPVIKQEMKSELVEDYGTKSDDDEAAYYDVLTQVDAVKKEFGEDSSDKLYEATTQFDPVIKQEIKSELVEDYVMKSDDDEAAYYDVLTQVDATNSASTEHGEECAAREKTSVYRSSETQGIKFVYKGGDLLTSNRNGDNRQAYNRAEVYLDMAEDEENDAYNAATQVDTGKHREEPIDQITDPYMEDTEKYMDEDESMEDHEEDLYAVQTQVNLLDMIEVSATSDEDVDEETQGIKKVSEESSSENDSDWYNLQTQIDIPQMDDSDKESDEDVENLLALKRIKSPEDISKKQQTPLRFIVKPTSSRPTPHKSVARAEFAGTGSTPKKQKQISIERKAIPIDPQHQKSFKEKKDSYRIEKESFYSSKAKVLKRPERDNSDSSTWLSKKWNARPTLSKGSKSRKFQKLATTNSSDDLKRKMLEAKSKMAHRKEEKIAEPVPHAKRLRTQRDTECEDVSDVQMPDEAEIRKKGLPLLESLSLKRSGVKVNVSSANMDSSKIDTSGKGGKLESSVKKSEIKEGTPLVSDNYKSGHRSQSHSADSGTKQVSYTSSYKDRSTSSSKSKDTSSDKRKDSSSHKSKNSSSHKNTDHSSHKSKDSSSHKNKEHSSRKSADTSHKSKNSSSHRNKDTSSHEGKDTSSEKSMDTSSYVGKDISSHERRDFSSDKNRDTSSHKSTDISSDKNRHTLTAKDTSSNESKDTSSHGGKDTSSHEIENISSHEVKDTSSDKGNDILSHKGKDFSSDTASDKNKGTFSHRSIDQQQLTLNSAVDSTITHVNKQQQTLTPKSILTKKGEKSTAKKTVKFKLSQTSVPEHERKTIKYRDFILLERKYPARTPVLNQSADPQVTESVRSHGLSEKGTARPQTVNRMLKPTLGKENHTQGLRELPGLEVKQPNRPYQPLISASGPVLEQRITVDDFLKNLLQWNPVWFKEQETYKLPPSQIEQENPLFPLHETYSNYNDYVRIFTPHLLFETWEMACRGWQQQTQLRCPAQSVFLSGVEASQDKQLMTFVWYCVTSQQKYNQGKCPSDADLVVVNTYIHAKRPPLKPGLPPQEGPEWHPTLGYVEKVQLIWRGDMKARILNALPLLRKEASKMSPGQDMVILCLRIKTKYRNMKLLNDKASTLQHVVSLVSLIRQYVAMTMLPENKLKEHILKPGNPGVYGEKQIVTKTQEEQLLRFNSSQQRAICTAAKVAGQSPILPRVCLLQGPPGTGKSHTIVGIINKIVQDMGSRARICLCAPSNAAVDELVRRLIQHKKQMSKTNSNYVLRLVRIGKVDAINRDVIKYSVKELIKRNIETEIKFKSEKNIPESTRNELMVLRNKTEALRKQVENHRRQQDIIQMKRVEIDLGKLEKRRRDIESQCKKLCENVRLTPEEENMIRKNVLWKANVICGTLNSFGNATVQNLLAGVMDKQRFMFHCLIMDEASQATELDCLIPLQYGTNKLIMVGDPEQLPPTVLSKMAADKNFGQSLFERLYGHFRFQDDNPVLLLDTQYRMDPEIAAFPSHYVYQGRLKSDVSVERRCKDFQLKPYIVFDLADGQEVTSGSGSVSNQAEAGFTLALCNFILSRTNIPQRAIGIIAPYQSQKSLLVSRLIDKKMTDVEVGTVDGFQGREKQVIILSCVRARSVSGGIGFLADRRRMNVALTRAKSALYVLGHLESLQNAGGDWKILIQDARNRDKVIRVGRQDNIHDVVKVCWKTPS